MKTDTVRDFLKSPLAVLTTLLVAVTVLQVVAVLSATGDPRCLVVDCIVVK